MNEDYINLFLSWGGNEWNQEIKNEIINLIILKEWNEVNISTNEIKYALQNNTNQNEFKYDLPSTIKKPNRDILIKWLNLDTALSELCYEKKIFSYTKIKEWIYKLIKKSIVKKKNELNFYKEWILLFWEKKKQVRWKQRKLCDFLFIENQFKSSCNRKEWFNYIYWELNEWFSKRFAILIRTVNSNMREIWIDTITITYSEWDYIQIVDSI